MAVDDWNGASGLGDYAEANGNTQLGDGFLSRSDAISSPVRCLDFARVSQAFGC